MMRILTALVVAMTAFSATLAADDVMLVPGGSHFWRGAYVDTTGDNASPSYEVFFRTAGGATRLRVAADLILDYRADRSVNEGVHTSAEDGKSARLTLYEIDENGTERRVTEVSGNAYSLELFAWLPNADARRWKARLALAANDFEGWTFRVRAKLEDDVTLPPGLLLPNLRAIPPFELTFCEPQVTIGFLVAHTPICGADSNGLTSSEEDIAVWGSCEETVESCSVHWGTFPRGLRFSTGPENSGDGSFEVFARVEDTFAQGANGLSRKPAYQRIHNASGHCLEPGACVTRPAGALEFDRTQGHWQYPFFRYELFEFVGPGLALRKLTARGDGRKAGFCPGDERLADWDRFFQRPRFFWQATRAEEDFVHAAYRPCLNPDAPMMGLSPGWGDVYEWARLEQFVVFPVDPYNPAVPKDGQYALVVTVDADGLIDETSDDDNVSYALFEVKDGRITILRRGYGDPVAR